MSGVLKMRADEKVGRGRDGGGCHLALLALLVGAAILSSPTAARGQTFDGPEVRVPLDASSWTSHADTMAFGTLWGQPSVYVGTGAAFANGFDFRNGTIEFELGAPQGTGFMGLAFRVQSPDAYEMVFFRPFASGTTEAIQYQPSLNGSGTWQLFHGPANGSAAFSTERWVPIRIVVQGSRAGVFVDGSSTPQLVVNDLALGDSAGTLGLWTGSFGSGAYLSNLRFTPDEESYPAVERAPIPEGTIMGWELSEALAGEDVALGELPDLDRLLWEPVRAEAWPMRPAGAPGIVWVNRYRRSPDVGTGGASLAGQVPGTRVVFARTTLSAAEAQRVRLHFGYTDNVEVFLNGEPLFMGMNPLGMRTLRGVMEMQGEAVYLPLEAGDNELVFAVTEYFGGWAFWGKLEPGG